ncbi:unnamed protein product [Caenorhabditis brenneri]
MEPRKLFLVTIILLVGINDFKAEQTTTLDEPLEKLSLISHLLNSIAIRNGFNSGYPNIHTGIAEFLKIPKRNSLLKFLELDVASTMKLFKEFNNSMDKIKLPGRDGSHGMLKLIRTLSWLKRYQGRLTDKKIDKAKEEIDKYQETLEEVEKNLGASLERDYFPILYIWLKESELTKTTGRIINVASGLELCLKYMNEELDGILEHRRKFNNYFDLKNAVKTFRIFLELFKELSEIPYDLKDYSSFLNASMPSLNSWSSGLNPLMSMELQNFIQTLTLLVPSPNQPLSSISFVETQNIKNELPNKWFGETIVKNHSLEHLNLELYPVFEFFSKISLMYPEWENEIIKGFGPLVKDFTEQADRVFDAVKYGKQLSNIEEADIQCLQGFGKWYKVEETEYDAYKKNLTYLERQLDRVNQKVQKFVFEVPASVFKVTMTKLEPLRVIVLNDALNVTEKWDLIQAWRLKSPGDIGSTIESLRRIKDSLEYLKPSIVTPATPPDIIFPSDEFKNLLKSTNIFEVVNCTDESSLSNMDKLIRFLKNVHAIQGAKPTLSKTLDLMEKAKGLQEGIRSVIKNAIDSGKSRFQKNQNLQNTAEDVSDGIRSLQNIQKLLQNFDSITNLTQNLHNLPDFNNDDRIKIVNLWRELQDYNATLASFPTDSNFSDLWSTVFQEAMKIRDVDFTLDQIEQLKVFSELPISGNRDKIHLALKAFSEVEAILEKVLGPEEEKKVIGNTIKEGFRAKFTPIPHKSSFAYNIFKIYYLEMVFVVTIVSFPLGFWLYERSKEIILNSN